MTSIKISALAGRYSARLNRVVEFLIATLLLLLILMVWLGVLVRYMVDFPITFTEEASRYLMIWMALLAISCGIARREHIGVLMLLERLPQGLRQVLLLLLDLLAFCFFALLFYYGISFMNNGWQQLTMIYDIPKAIPFASVPIASALACVQVVLVALRDQGRVATASEVRA